MNAKEISKKIKLHLKRLEIKRSNNIVIHSDLITFGIYHSLLPKIFFKSLISIIGSKGTIALPIYNIDPDKKKIIDLNKDFNPSENSSLSKYFFKKFKYTKTKSIFHSHMIKGPLEKKFSNNVNHNSFGDNSDFDFFYKNNFKLLLFGCDAAKACTYLHHIEDKFKPRYRVKKVFKVKIKINKTIVDKYITYQVRKKNIKLNFNKIFFLKKIKKITKTAKLKFGKSYLVNIREFDHLCSKIIRKKKNILIA